MSRDTHNLNRESLAIIPARGGSKGIPRKNVLPLAGRPLIAWTIEAARQAKGVSRVVVSTDSPEIAQVARTFGAEVVDRPAEISGDRASSESALLHTLDHLRESEGYEPDRVVFLQCTSPLTTSDDIDGTIRVMDDQHAETALAVIPFHYFLWKPGADGDAVGINHDKRVRLMRQQREPEYLEAGSVYVMQTSGFRQHKHRFFGKTAMYMQPAENRWEIDEVVDFEVAEQLLRARLRRDAGRLLPDPVSALIMDFDGVLTDNGVWTGVDGAESVRCDRSDGWGLARVREFGVPLVVLSTEKHPVVAARCRKLQIECEQGLDNKVAALRAWAEKNGVDLRNAVYVGNDENDNGCLEAVGCAVVPSDAHPEAMRRARIVLTRPGGRGAVRELCDMIRERSQR